MTKNTYHSHTHCQTVLVLYLISNIPLPFCLHKHYSTKHSVAVSTTCKYTSHGQQHNHAQTNLHKYDCRYRSFYRDSSPTQHACETDTDTQNYNTHYHHTVLPNTQLSNKLLSNTLLSNILFILF